MLWLSHELGALSRGNREEAVVSLSSLPPCHENICFAQFLEY